MVFLFPDTLPILLYFILQQLWALLRYALETVDLLCILLYSHRINIPYVLIINFVMISPIKLNVNLLVNSNFIYIQGSFKKRYFLIKISIYYFPNWNSFNVTKTIFQSYFMAIIKKLSFICPCEFSSRVNLNFIIGLWNI